ncbi:MAG: DNA cytosine methyltransferase, partial [Alphaproteobacteria bacterium]|nr:DNA cytosine methyltransferase [Alphaproteobacteria bacterium]
MTFVFLSICSGLEGASLALEPHGGTCAGVAEIEKFPATIIAHRYGSNMPGEPLSYNAPPNFGDFTQLIDPSSESRAYLSGKRVDVLIGGTPCQAFSIAGKRLSLDDARGNLTLAFAVLAHELVRF